MGGVEGMQYDGAAALAHQDTARTPTLSGPTQA
jgi:hypothetical protein